MDATLPQNRALLIKEVRYRASYRGTLELDNVCRCLLPELENMDDAELIRIRDLLQQSESHLMAWLVEGVEAPQEWRQPVKNMREYFLKNHVSKKVS